MLEVGVGTGLALPHYKPHLQVTGVDLSPDMLLRARRAGARGTSLPILKPLLEMDATALEFADASFDVSTAMYVMTVVPDPAKVMHELARVTKPGGHVVIVNHFSVAKGPRAVDREAPVRILPTSWLAAGIPGRDAVRERTNFELTVAARTQSFRFVHAASLHDVCLDRAGVVSPDSNGSCMKQLFCSGGNICGGRSGSARSCRAARSLPGPWSTRSTRKRMILSSNWGREPAPSPASSSPTAWRSNKLILIELDRHFAGYLRRQFPAATVVEDECRESAADS